MDMQALQAATKWELKKGGHSDWQNGTCINEAAILAAGLEHRPVMHPGNLPASFSPTMAGFLMGLNDVLPHVERQKLFRFVGWLPVSAASADIESARHGMLMPARKKLLSGCPCGDDYCGAGRYSGEGVDEFLDVVEAAFKLKPGIEPIAPEVIAERLAPMVAERDGLKAPPRRVPIFSGTAILNESAELTPNPIMYTMQAGQVVEYDAGTILKLAKSLKAAVEAF